MIPESNHFQRESKGMAPVPTFSGSFENGAERDASFRISGRDSSTYYPFPSFTQRLELLKQLVLGGDELILVIGERGLGKTTFLKVFLDSFEVDWSPCDILISSTAKESGEPLSQNFMKHRAFILQHVEPPVLVLDDAHWLKPAELRRLVQNAREPGSANEWKRLVLLCEPQFDLSLAEFKGPKAHVSVNRVFLPNLTIEQTAEYLHHRLLDAGYERKIPFSQRDIKMLHDESQGVPGRLNELSRQLLSSRFSQKKRFVPAILSHKRLKKPWLYLLPGIAVVVVLCLMLFGKNPLHSFFSPQTKPTSQPDQIITQRRSELSRISIVVPQSARPIKELDEARPLPPIKELDEARPLPPIKELDEARPLPSIKELDEDRPLPSMPLGPRETLVYGEEWLLRQPSNHFTIQILGVQSEEALVKFIEAYQFAGQVAYYKTRFKKADWYPLLYGVYPNVEEAVTVLKELPPQFQKFSPWIRRLSTVHAAIRANGR